MDNVLGDKSKFIVTGPWDCKLCGNTNKGTETSCKRCGHEPVLGSFRHEQEKWNASHKQED